MLGEGGGGEWASRRSFEYVLLTNPSGSMKTRPRALFFFGIKSKNRAKKYKFSLFLFLFFFSFLIHRRQRILPAALASLTIRGNIITQPAIENPDLGPDPNTRTPRCIVLLLLLLLPFSRVSFNPNLRDIYPPAVQITRLWPPYK